MSHIVYLSLGSNVGDRVAQITDAVERLDAVGKVLAVSKLYETSPVEFSDQPWFLNAVARIETRLDPERLMGLLLDIERAMGRERTRPKGPRTIDLDILLFDDREFHSDKVDIPHPAMHLRRFVLIPLAELAPELRHPTFKQIADEMLTKLPPNDIVRPYSGTDIPNTLSARQR